MMEVVESSPIWLDGFRLCFFNEVLDLGIANIDCGVVYVVFVGIIHSFDELGCLDGTYTLETIACLHESREWNSLLDFFHISEDNVCRSFSKPFYFHNVFGGHVDDGFDGVEPCIVELAEHFLAHLLCSTYLKEEDNLCELDSAAARVGTHKLLVCSVPFGRWTAMRTYCKRIPHSFTWFLAGRFKSF